MISCIFTKNTDALSWLSNQLKIFFKLVIRGILSVSKLHFQLSFSIASILPFLTKIAESPGSTIKEDLFFISSK